MPPSRPLQVAAVVAGAGALVGAGVALGRGIGRGIERGDDAAPSLWPAEILTLRYQGLDIHRRAPGSYVARAGDHRWTLPRYVKGARFRVGTATLTAAEWRVITGMIEAGWSLLDVVPGGRNVHDLRMVLKELPLDTQYSLIIERPIQIIRRVSDRLFYGVDHPRGGSDPIPHLPIWDRQRDHVLPHGFDLTRRQWVLYTGILEAAWMVGETMDGSIGGGPEDEGKR